MAVVHLTILWHSTDKHVIVYVVGSANFSSRENQFLELKCILRERSVRRVSERPRSGATRTTALLLICRFP